MAFTWPVEELTVRGKVGIGTDTPSQELDVIGDISARNLNLNGSLTIDKNLSVGGNFQLGTLSINTFSSDGNLADNSNLAVPTEQAVKTYVDNQISTRAALNGAANQDFATNNLSVGGNLRVSGNLEVQGDVIARDTEHIAGNVSLGDQDSDEVQITGVIRSGHSSGALRIDDALHTTGSVTVDGSLSVSNAIATAQLSVTDRVTGSLSIENNLTVGGSLTTSEVNATGTIQANRFEGDGSSLEGIVKKTGDTMTGSLTIANNLTVNGNIKTTGIISGSSLPPNLIRNSYMNILDGNKPAGYRIHGNVTIDAAHPYTKGFEGPYVAEKPSNAASSVDTATLANPYWFRRYYKGARASSGGLADGWRSLPDGRILKITGDNSADHTSVYFPFESNMLTNKVHFKAWLKITTGSKVGFGVASGHGNLARGLIITKEQTDEAPDGWYQIDAVIGISEVTNLDSWAFSMGIEARGSFEVYLALPYVANLDNDTWLPSVSDMLSRDGLTVHPSSRNVGIGTTTPEAKLDVAGIIKAKGYKTKIYTDGGIRVGQVGLKKDNIWRVFPNLSRTFTLAETATVIAFYKISMPGDNTYNSHLVTRLIVDGSEVSRTIVGNTNYWGNSDFWVDELAAGTHSIQVQYRTRLGGINNPALTDWHNRVLRIMVLGS
ncbi:MAG: DUF342 domain-containing protein [Moorea sp. SIO4A3]|nr:DUF342 domain-containing protein [Moorena sp. SIO4A3]